MYAKKNECPTCNKKLQFVKITKLDGKTTHIAIHEGDTVPENGIVIDYRDISHTYRKRLRDAIHINDAGKVNKPVFDATGMNRFVMVAEAINIMKENGMSDEDANALRKQMLVKGSNFQTDIELAAPFLTIVRN